jgi:hypothetical protein
MYTCINFTVESEVNLITEEMYDLFRKFKLICV